MPALTIMPEQEVRVLILSSQPVMALGLTQILSTAGGMAVLGTVRELSEALGFPEPPPGSPHPVLLVDHSEQVHPGQLQQFLAGETPWRVAILSRTIAPEAVFHFREAGVAAFISTTREGESLQAMIEAVSRGELIMDARLSAVGSGSNGARLSPREAELSLLLAHGLKNKQIATILGITEGTVKVYLSHLFQKVGVKDRLEMALYCIRHAADGTFDDARARIAHRRMAQAGLPGALISGAAVPAYR